MQVSHVDKNMVEQSSTVPLSIYKEYLNPALGLTLSPPGLVAFKVSFPSVKYFDMQTHVILMTKFRYRRTPGSWGDSLCLTGDD